MDCSAIVLNKLIEGRDLEVWSRIKLVFLDPAFSSLYSAIGKYYDTYNAIPSFEELELSLREGAAKRALAVVKLAKADEVSVDLAINALIDQYTQNEAISLLDKFADKLPVLDTEEIKEELAGIVLQLDEKTHTSNTVFLMSEVQLFKNEADLARDRVHLGFNNLFDATLAGVARQELILVGGPRGSGKSIWCSNIQVNQYEMGNTCPYFTIEMVHHEILERNFAIQANVDHLKLKQNKLSDEELLRVIKARAGQFLDADDLVEDFQRHKNKFKFESDLIRYKKLKPDNQMIIVDDRALTITALDLHLGKIKARFGDKFTVAVVDYLNQIVLEGSSQFDWQPQIVISKKLKELARKHDIIIASPYQIDATGEARFAKGILDAPDIAIKMKAEKDRIEYDTTKIRGGPPMKFASAINWETLRIYPQNITIDETSDPEEEAPTTKRKLKGKKAKTQEPVPDASADIPWDV